MQPVSTVSVVIPCHNGEAYLAETIQSVLSQTAGPVEIIVVDDGSTDNSAQIALSHGGVRCVSQEKSGVAAAINNGVAHATGELLAFVSADDVWKNNKLDLQRAALSDTPNRLVFGHMLHFLSPELTGEAATSLKVPEAPMPAYSAGTLLTLTRTFRSVGPLDETYTVGEFMDWYGRAKDAGFDIIMLDDVVSMRRVHPSNHSTQALKSKSYAPVLKALLDRRRRLDGKS